MGYSTAPWASFGEALAAVAGALTGLLFVALSVNSDALAASRSLRGPRHSNPAVSSTRGCSLSGNRRVLMPLGVSPSRPGLAWPGGIWVAGR